VPGYRATPILLVTSLSDFRPSFRASPEGATDLIVKPFLFMELGLTALFHAIGFDERWVPLPAG
jgi:FixJ family two-component response regulator